MSMRKPKSDLSRKRKREVDPNQPKISQSFKPRLSGEGDFYKGNNVNHRYQKRRKVHVLDSDAKPPPKKRKHPHFGSPKEPSAKGNSLYNMASKGAKPKPSLFGRAVNTVRTLVLGKPSVLPGPFFKREDLERRDGGALLVAAVTTSIWPEELLEEQKTRKQGKYFSRLEKKQQLTKPPKKWMSRFRKWALQKYPDFPERKTWAKSVKGDFPKGFKERFENVPKDKVVPEKEPDVDISDLGSPKNPVVIDDDKDEKTIIRRSKLKRQKSESAPPPLEKHELVQCPLCLKQFAKDKIQRHAATCGLAA